MGGELFLVFLYLDRFEVFSLEDLAAIQALDIFYPVAPGNHLGSGMLASGLHNSA
jgi:hypothetical protein